MTLLWLVLVVMVLSGVVFEIGFREFVRGLRRVEAARGGSYDLFDDIA